MPPHTKKTPKLIEEISGCQRWQVNKMGEGDQKTQTCSYKISPRDVIRRRQWHPIPVLLPGESYGWRSLVGCSPWGREESDMTERLHFHFSLSCIGEGNGNPLQCPCLENPRDGGAWWAAVHGVAQSRTPLTWLSSSSRDVVYSMVTIINNTTLCIWKLLNIDLKSSHHKENKSVTV